MKLRTYFITECILIMDISRHKECHIVKKMVILVDKHTWHKCLKAGYDSKKCFVKIKCNRDRNYPLCKLRYTILQYCNMCHICYGQYNIICCRELAVVNTIINLHLHQKQKKNLKLPRTKNSKPSTVTYAMVPKEVPATAALTSNDTNKFRRYNLN